MTIHFKKNYFFLEYSNLFFGILLTYLHLKIFFIFQNGMRSKVAFTYEYEKCLHCFFNKSFCIEQENDWCQKSRENRFRIVFFYYRGESNLELTQTKALPDCTIIIEIKQGCFLYSIIIFQQTNFTMGQSSYISFHICFS